MGISSGAFLFVIAVFYRVDAANYRVKLLLTPRFDSNEVLFVSCGTTFSGKIDSRVVRESTKSSSLEVRCTDVNDIEGVLFKLEPSEKSRRLPDKAGGWRGYWNGVIIDISEEVVGLSQGSDCLGSYFDVRKLEQSGFAYDVAVVDSDQAYGKFGSYFNTDYGAPVFAYEQELRDYYSNDIEGHKISCFNNSHTTCCSVQKPHPSTFLVSMHIYDDYKYDGMIICVGDSLGSCKYGVYKGGVTHLKKFWRSFNISIPRDVLYTKSEKKITFERDLFITIYGSVIGPDSEAERITFKYETVSSISYDTYVEYLVDTDTFISDQKIILNSIRKISAPGSRHTSSREKIIELEVDGLPQSEEEYEFEFLYLDGYQPRRQPERWIPGMSLLFPIRFFGEPYDVIPIYFRINKESDWNVIYLRDNDLIPEFQMSGNTLYKSFRFKNRLNSFSTAEN